MCSCVASLNVVEGLFFREEDGQWVEEQKLAISEDVKKDIDDHKEKWITMLTKLEEAFEHSTPR